MKILCVLYDDPKEGMPSSYPLKELPKLEKYPDGMTLPSPKGRDFNAGELLGCVSGELGLRNPFVPTIEWHKHQSPNTWIRLFEDFGFKKQSLSW